MKEPLLNKTKLEETYTLLNTASKMGGLRTSEVAIVILNKLTNGEKINIQDLNALGNLFDLAVKDKDSGGLQYAQMAFGIIADLQEHIKPQTQEGVSEDTPEATQ